MAERTDILNIQPLSETNSVEIMLASRYASGVKFLIANGAHVVKLTELLIRRLWERIDLVDRITSTNEL